MKRPAPNFEHSLGIAAPPQHVLRAFFDPAALAVWWQAKRSVTTPRALGVYAVEWERTDFSDEVLGPLGGVFYGTVIDHDASAGFFVGGAYWLPPIGESIGPMALHVSCVACDPLTVLRVVQSGYQAGLRWNRYYSIIESGWKLALASLKRYVERAHASPIAPFDPSDPTHPV